MLKFCLAGLYPIDSSRIGGGVLNVVYLLGETFAERTDIEFHLVGFAKGFEGISAVERPGMIFHRIGQPKNHIVPNVLTQAAKVASVLRDIKPDVVNSHSCVATEAAAMAGCKVVHTVHGVIHNEVKYLRGKDGLATRLYSFIERKAMNKADAVISVAQYGLDAYARCINCPTETIGVPIEDMFAQVSPLISSKSIVFAGGISRRKNLSALVKAMPSVICKHPDAVLYVCGGVNDRRYKHDLDTFIRANGISDVVRFLGVVDRQELAGLLERSVALVLPSYQETSPGVICQAMAAGRVPVASFTGGIPEMIEDGVTGFLVDADDSETLAGRIIKLMDEPDMARRMGSAAKEVAKERYDRHKVADRIIDICSSLVASGKQGDNHGI